MRATKENNLDLHLVCLQEMCPLLFSMDHMNYAKYLSVYFISLLNIKHTHPGADRLLRDGGFSVSRSDVTTSRNAVDQTIEQTINRHAKSHGGIIGFSRNFAAYYRWCVTRHMRGSFLAAAMELAGMTDEEETNHKDTRPSEIRKTEEDVQKLLESFQNFSSPFDTDERKALFCLSSGKPAPPEVMEDLLECEQRGISAFNNFVQQRLMEKSVSFHSPMKKLSLKTFSYTHVKTKVQSTKIKTVQIAAQMNIFGQLLVLAREHDISLEKALTYPMSPVPWALANPDGLPVKTDKAKLVHMLEKHVDFEHPQLESCTFVIDGNAMLQSLVGLPGTFGELAQKIFSLLPKSERVDFVTDTYQEHSIKASERARRGTTETFLLKGPLTKIPKDWKGFLSNGQNKMEVMKLVLSEWQKTNYASKLKGWRI